MAAAAVLKTRSKHTKRFKGTLILMEQYKLYAFWIVPLKSAAVFCVVVVVYLFVLTVCGLVFDEDLPCVECMHFGFTRMA